MQCQFEHGRRLGSAAADPWRAGLEGLPTPDEVDGASRHPCRP
jgi:hypothetical protein